MVLCEITDVQIARLGARATERRQLTSQQFHAGGFAGPVPAEQRQPVAGHDGEFHIAKQRDLAVTGALIVDRQQRPRQFGRLRKRKFESRGIDMRRRNALHPFQRLQAALGLTCLGRLRAKPFDERFHMLDLALLACVQRGLLGQFGRALRLEGRVVAAIGARLLVFNVDDAIADAIEKLAVMCDQ